MRLDVSGYWGEDPTIISWDRIVAFILVMIWNPWASLWEINSLNSSITSRGFLL
jgi:hypothetical protein